MNCWVCELELNVANRQARDTKLGRYSIRLFGILKKTLGAAITRRGVHIGDR